MVAFEPILKDKYEVIVIGAGIGGLATAAVMAQKGVEVLILEQSHEPGGCCSSLRLGDFTFDTAASVMQGFGEVGFHVVRTLFDFLGQQVELVPRDSAYSMYFGEERIDFHRDRQAFTAELGAIFPQHSGSILAYMRDLEHLYHAVLDCSGPLRPSSDKSGLLRFGLMAQHPASYARVSRAQRSSAEAMLSRHVDDPRVRAFFEADVTYNTGYGLSELAAPQAALCAIDRHVGGTHHAIGSAQQIADKLEKSIGECGGRVAYRVAVEEVLVRDGRAVGVRLSGGREINSELVIANTSTSDLFGKMIAEEHLQPQTLAWAQSLESAQGVIALYLGVPEESVPNDFNPNTVLVDQPDSEPGRFISVSIPSLFDPNLSPEGFHCMTIHSVTDPDIWPRAVDPSYPSDEYREQREVEGRKVLKRLEPLLPGLMEQSVVHAVLTPSTFERILRRERGALAGPRVPGQLVPVGLPGSATEIEDLFLTGDSTVFGRGVAEVTASGIHCGLLALRSLGLRAPRFHEVRESFVLETVPVRPQISGADVVDSISASLESHRCLHCADAPCMLACPANIDIPNFIRRIGAADLDGAARLIRETNPLGEVCGLVCPAESLCEGACLRSEIDTHVKISQMEAYVCGCTQEPRGWPEPYRGIPLEKVAVIGSGPAGLSCAFYLSLLGHRVEVFEEEMEAGGLPARAMSEFRLNHKVLRREIGGTLSSGVEFWGNTSFGEDINLEYLWREGFQAVFIAAGRQAVKQPGITGADLPGVIDALSFMGSARRRVKRELSPNVAVLGCENIAVDAAILAVELGAENVYLVMERKTGESGAAPQRVSEARDRGVQIATNRKAIEIVGEGRVESLKVPPGPNVLTMPPVGEPEQLPNMLDVGTVILAGKREPSPRLMEYLAGQLRITPEGTILVDPETLSTSRPGIFAGGEITGGGGLVVAACNQGRRAAMSIHHYLTSKSSAPESTPWEELSDSS